MEISREGEQRAHEIMLNNLHFTNSNQHLGANEKAAVLQASFWNTLLRFIVIDGKEYPTNSKMYIHSDLFWDYTNPHEEDVRVSYDVEKQILFFEEKELIPHPFIVDQRIDRDQMIGVMMKGYSACGFTNPNEKIAQWKKFNKEILIDEIISMTIESFWDKPMIWNNRDDYTAYKIIVTTR